MSVAPLPQYLQQPHWSQKSRDGRRFRNLPLDLVAPRRPKARTPHAISIKFDLLDITSCSRRPRHEQSAALKCEPERWQQRERREEGAEMNTFVSTNVSKCSGTSHQPAHHTQGWLLSVWKTRWPRTCGELWREHANTLNMHAAAAFSLSWDNDLGVAIYLNSGCVNKALPHLLQWGFKK